MAKTFKAGQTWTTVGIPRTMYEEIKILQRECTKPSFTNRNESFDEFTRALLSVGIQTWRKRSASLPK